MISIAESDQDYDSSGADDTVVNESSQTTTNCKDNLHYLYINSISYNFFIIPLLTNTFSKQLPTKILVTNS
jgi:hypothetical protein